MAKRRRIQGKPLLLASTTVAIAVGCAGGSNPPIRTGNLMPPPMMKGEVCITVTPEDAAVTLDGMAVDEPCEAIESHGMVTVEATAPGHEPYSQSVELTEKVELTIALVPKPPPPPPPPPIDIPPPPPPPVGNLMPPPDIDLDPPPPLEPMPEIRGPEDE